MKNIQNRINAQLFKQKTVELQSEKVELGLVQDLDKKWRDAQKDIGKARQLGRELYKMYTDMADALTEVEKEGVKALGMAKELGAKDAIAEIDDVLRKTARDKKGALETAKRIGKF